jgi:hypothetical protein
MCTNTCQNRVSTIIVFKNRNTNKSNILNYSYSIDTKIKKRLSHTMARQNIRLVLIDLHQNNITHMYNAITKIDDSYFQEQITGISIISNKFFLRTCAIQIYICNLTISVIVTTESECAPIRVKIGCQL